MKLYKCISKTKALLIWTLLLLSSAGLFVFAQECKAGAVSGIFLCAGVLVPSLFPFCIISSFMGESSLAECLSPLFNPVGKILLNRRGICVIPLVMSLAGGYPIGARTIAALYKKGLMTKSEASDISLIAVGAGPGFLITFVGISLLGSKESGIILLSSQIISMVVLCLILRFTRKPDTTPDSEISPVTTLSASEALVNAVSDSVRAMGAMCGFVILFSVLCSVLTEGLNIKGIFADILLSLLEVTTGVTTLSGKQSLIYISMLTGFGGLCVHLQIFRELKGIPFSKKRFYLYRIYQSISSLFATKILLLIFPVKEAVFSSIDYKPQVNLYSTIIAFGALAVTSVFFILSLHKKA